MPFVQITMGEGRSDGMKTALLREITDAFVRSGCADAAAVRSWIVEVPVKQIMAGEVLLADKLRQART